MVSPSRFPQHWSITSDSTDASELRSIVVWLQLRLLNVSHVYISSFKISQKWKFSMDANGIPLKNAKLVLVYTRSYSYPILGPFDHPD